MAASGTPGEPVAAKRPYMNRSQDGCGGTYSTRYMKFHIHINKMILFNSYVMALFESISC
jgi:hypothetical protein